MCSKLQLLAVAITMSQEWVCFTLDRLCKIVTHKTATSFPLNNALMIRNNDQVLLQYLL